MTDNRYYAPDARAEKVQLLFSTIARRYDLMNDLMSFGLHRCWKRRVAQLAQGSPTHRALDLCCGTGDIARALAKGGAHVIGLDFAQPMLAIAQQKHIGPHALASSCTYLRGDALRLPFPDATFDALTIGYGLRNLADFEAGLREMHRVTKKNGRVIILDFGVPDNRLWRALYLFWLRLAVPFIGLLIAGDRAAYRYILTSLEHYPAQRGIADLMQKVGFTNIRIINLLGGVSSIHVGTGNNSENCATVW